MPRFGTVWRVKTRESEHPPNAETRTERQALYVPRAGWCGSGVTPTPCGVVRGVLDVFLVVVCGPVLLLGLPVGF